MQVKTVTAAPSYGSGTQEITHNCGERPEAVLCFVFKGYKETTDKSEIADGYACMGFAAYNGGTTQERSIASINIDNVSTTDAAVSPGVDSAADSAQSLIQLMDDTSDPVDTYANITDWDPDSDGNKIELTWDSSISMSTGMMLFVFFYGDDVSAYVGSDYIATGSTEYQNVGFEPEIVFAVCNSFSASVTANAFWNYGVAVNPGGSGSADQGCISNYAYDSSASTLAQAYTSDDEAGRDQAVTSLRISYDLDDFDSNGFDITGTSGFGGRIGYLALKCDNAVSVTAHQTPTSTGSQGYTDPGFTPQCIVGFFGHPTSVGTLFQTSYNDCFSIGVVGPDENEWSGLMCNQDALTTTDTFSSFSYTSVGWLRDTSGDLASATFTSFDANGWTLNWGTVPGANQSQFIVLAIEEEESGPTVDPQYETVTITENSEKVVESQRVDSEAITITEGQDVLHTAGQSNVPRAYHLRQRTK